MTTVEFHTGVDEPLAHACRWLRARVDRGGRAAVVGPSDTLARLDQALWTFDALSFVPHRRAAQAVDEPAWARTPVWLLDEPAVAARGNGRPAVVLNLGETALADPASWERVVELVPGDAEGRQAARARWRAYKAAGWQPADRPAADVED